MTQLHIVRKRLKSGSRWYVYAWRGGPQIHQCDGAPPVITQDIFNAQMRAKNEAGGRDTDDIDALIADYEASPEYTDRRKSTKKDYRLWLTRISERFGDTPLAAFEDRRIRGDIITWRNNWAGQPRTADKASVMMSTILNWAVENGRLSVNVAAKIKQLHHADKSQEIWEERHWKAVEAVKDFPAHVMRVLRLACLTGLRLGDLVHLDWSQVGPQTIIVEKTRKRGGRAIIPIVPELRALLDSIGGSEGRVLLNSRGTGWTESGLETVWQRKKPKDFDRTIHDIRGTYVTFLAMKGLTDDEIARVIGWTAKKIGEIRARYVDEARVVVSMVERLSA